MKNFARLVRFSWPYRVRFALSLFCAMLVGLLWGANLSVALPLMKILFYNQNCQIWINDQIDSSELERARLSGRLEELDNITRLSAANRRDELSDHFQTVRAEHEALSDGLRDDVSGIDLIGPQPPALVEATVGEIAQLNARKRAFAVIEARLDELKRSAKKTEDGDHSDIETRRDKLNHDKADAETWLRRYQWCQPFIQRYLPDDAFRTLLLIIGVVMASVALKGLFLFFQEVLVADIVQLCLFDIRNKFYRRTMALDLAHFSKQNSADLIARFTNDMESVGQGLSTVLGRVIREPLRALNCLGIALWLNWRLTLLALVVLPISVATANRAGRVMKRAVRKSLESMSNIYKILQETFQGISVVKAYTTERRERRRFFLETKALYKKAVRVATIDAMSDPVLEQLALTTVSIALLAGSYLVLRRTTFLDLGFIKLQLANKPPAIEDLLYFYVTLAGISDPVRKMANVHSKIQRAAAAADRICVLMDREPEVKTRPGSVRMGRHLRGIEFEDVAFRYDQGEPVLRGLSLNVKHGETIALVGPNGCGKSTLMNLIPRFYDVTGGSIRIDGHDVRDIHPRSLRGQVAVVLQETILFEDTVANNIAYGRRDATRDEIIDAAKRSYAHQFISAMPEGYETMVGARGAGLSGGQRQRIALARAMLRDPAILILDEATSAVDIQDEALIRKAIEEFSRGRTTFLITHSLSSLQFADRIVLMNGGKIDAVGTEAELRRTSPLFRKLHEIHFQRESA
ncbi:ABC transporter ATP-binding protein [Isosphaeraceae bacterium EP7]